MNANDTCNCPTSNSSVQHNSTSLQLLGIGEMRVEVRSFLAGSSKVTSVPVVFIANALFLRLAVSDEIFLEIIKKHWLENWAKPMTKMIFFNVQTLLENIALICRQHSIERHGLTSTGLIDWQKVANNSRYFRCHTSSLCLRLLYVCRSVKEWARRIIQVLPQIPLRTDTTKTYNHLRHRTERTPYLRHDSRQIKR